MFPRRISRADPKVEAGIHAHFSAEMADAGYEIKSDFYTVLSSRDCLPEIEIALNADANLRQCFKD